MTRPQGKCTEHLVTFYANGTRKSFRLKPLSKEWIMKQLKSLSVHKARGPDTRSAQVLEDGAEILVVTTRHIINFSSETSKSIQSYQVAKVLSVVKNGFCLEARKYRPASLLPIISEIIEKVINEHVVRYLESTKTSPLKLLSSL